MRSQANVVIIGGGISGLSTAYALLRQRPNWTVTVLEQAAQAGRGASWANSAMIHPSQAWPWDEARSGDQARDIACRTYKLAQRSSAILHKHFDRFDLPHRHRKSGCMKIFHNQSALEAELERYEMLTAFGLRYDILSARGFSKKTGLPDGSAYAAVHFPDDHSGPARLYCAALIAAIIRMGGVIKCDQKVMSIDGGVHTQNASYQGDHYIVCAGHRADALLKVDVLRGLRGYSRTYHVPGLAGALPSVPIMDSAAHFALTPLGGHLRVSGGAQDVDARPGDIYERFEHFAFSLLPHLKDQLARSEFSDWTAVRPMSDQGPIIEYNERSKLWLNTGHGHMGWTLCAGAAEAITELICA